MSILYMYVPFILVCIYVNVQMMMIDDDYYYYRQRPLFMD